MITSLELAALPFNASFRSDCQMLEQLQNRLLYKIYMLELVSASGVDQRRRYLYLRLSSCVVNAAWAAPRTTSAHLSHHLQTTAVIRTLPPQMSAAVSDVLEGGETPKIQFHCLPASQKLPGETGGRFWSWQQEHKHVYRPTVGTHFTCSTDRF